MKTILISIFLFSFSTLISQKNQSITIEGTILNEENFSEIPYAQVYNLSTHKSTRANEHGEFQIIISSYRDSIRISYLGYLYAILKLDSSQNQYMVYLQPRNKTIRPVTITAKDNSYLNELIIQCKKKTLPQRDTAKAYYELKSHINSNQVELLESYYNATVDNYTLKSLDLKAGRIALRKYFGNSHLFTSQESSKAIIAYSPLESNEKFPYSPLAMNKSKQRKYFYFDVVDEYTNEKGDSIIHIRFKPKQETTEYFEGEIHINKSKIKFEDIKLQSAKASRFPFLPLTKYDRVRSVDYNLHYQFSENNRHSTLDQVDFQYTLNYVSRINTQDEKNYPITTHIALFIYDYSSKFLLPFFPNVHYTLPEDYSIINAYPYNEFFWRYNNELKIDANKKANDLFYNDSLSYTQHHIFSNLDSIKIHESPFVHWSTKRIYIDTIPEGVNIRKLMSEKENLASYARYLSQTHKNYWDKDNIVRMLFNGVPSAYYLHASLFMDINVYQDSTNVCTGAVFIPDSYCDLKFDRHNLLFINLYFDIYEIYRRRLDASISGLKNESSIISNYHSIQATLKKESTRFLNEFRDVSNRRVHMLQWNQEVKNTLGIDNFKTFSFY